MTTKNKKRLQNIFFENNDVLNYSKVSKSLNIPVSNTKFRKFLKQDIVELSDSSLNKIIDFAGYELITVPVKKYSINAQELQRIEKEGIDEIIIELTKLRDLSLKTKDVEKEKPVQKVDEDELAKRMRLNNALFGIEEEKEASTIDDLFFCE